MAGKGGRYYVSRNLLHGVGSALEHIPQEYHVDLRPDSRPEELMPYLENIREFSLSLMERLVVSPVDNLALVARLETHLVECAKLMTRIETGTVEKKFYGKIPKTADRDKLRRYFWEPIFLGLTRLAMVAERTQNLPVSQVIKRKGKEVEVPETWMEGVIILIIAQRNAIKYWLRFMYGDDKQHAGKDAFEVAYDRVFDAEAHSPTD